MDTFPDPDSNTVTSSIAAVRQAWLDAVRAGDAERLAAMVTDDVVVVHGNGRCVHGRDELKTDFLIVANSRDPMLERLFKTVALKVGQDFDTHVLRGREGGQRSCLYTIPATIFLIFGE